MTLILSNDDVEHLLSMRDCIDAMEVAYAELAEGRGVSRLRSDSFSPTSRKATRGGSIPPPSMRICGKRPCLGGSCWRSNAMPV